MEKKINILLVEDNPADARLIDIYLKETFGNMYSILQADYLSQGIEYLEKNNFNIILLDLTLPDSSGLNTFTKIKLKSALTPIILLTGLEDENMGINAMKLGVQDFLVKGTFSSHGLKRSINYSIERNNLLIELSENKLKLEQSTTELVVEQNKLIEAQKLEKLVFAATQSYNSVIIADRNGEIEWVNAGFTNLSGYTLESIKNTNESTLRNGKDKEHFNWDFFETVIKEKKPITYESRNFCKRGKEYWVITTLSPILDIDGEVERIIAIGSDITIRKHMEQELILANKMTEKLLHEGNDSLVELRKAKKELEESMKFKEQFLSNMSHEIRTPMNAIVGFTNLILKTPLTPDQQEFTDAIRTSGKNLLVIINDILDFSKIESGKIVFEKIDINISRILSTISGLLLQKSKEKNIHLSTNISREVPDHLIGDPTRLNQILLNLGENALKFSEGGTVEINIEVLTEINDIVELQFSVIDSGIGIPENKLSTIFEGFTQASNETTRKYGGTGLGLTIVKQLIELQGGTITAKSKLGKGSSFIFNLKFKKNLHSEAIPNEPYQEKNRIEGINVLLVEDNLLNQILAVKVLKDWNWTVEVADNGLIAIEKMEKNNFDIILMDIQLPEMDGYEATRYIRKKMPAPKCHVPILAMTAHAFSGEAEKCINAGMDGYISKPFEEEVLYTKIVAVLNKSRLSKKQNDDRKTDKSDTKPKYIDLTYLLELSKGSHEFMNQMIKIFVEQSPNDIANLEKYLKSNDRKSLLSATQKMKPLFLFTGIDELQSTLQSLEENLIKEKNTEHLPGLVSKLKIVCGEAMKELENEMSNFQVARQECGLCNKMDNISSCENCN